MPVHDGAAWLPHTLASVAAEDCTGIEFLLLDSSEDTACEAIADEFSHRLALSYTRTPDVKPWTAKTNRAVAQASAPHVAMLHQDDLWLPGRVADMRSAIGAHPDAALLLNPSQFVDRYGKPRGLWHCPLPAARPLEAEELAAHMLVQNFVAIPAPVIRREAWLNCGGMDEALWYTADWDLYLKLAREGATVYRDSVTTAFRIHGSSLTMTGSADRASFAAQLKTVIDRHVDILPFPERVRVHRLALASARINCALAGAASGKAGDLAGALKALLALGPLNAVQYWRDSRIAERVLSRVRARLAGAL